MKIGFIGFGEAAYNISLGLKGEGVTAVSYTHLTLPTILRV